MAERFVRLKDGSIAVCLDTSEPGAKYRYVRKGESSSDVGQWKSGGGTMWTPSGNPKIWNTPFMLREEDVLYELRFQPGDYVRTPDKRIVLICGIPANCGAADYTMNEIEDWGSWSSSYTISDPGLTPCTKEEAEAECEKRKAEYQEAIKNS